MLNINYFPHIRPQYHKLIFYFMEKIKPENKEKIRLNILTSGNMGGFQPPKGIDTREVRFKKVEPNYNEKVVWATNQDVPY